MLAATKCAPYALSDHTQKALIVTTLDCQEFGIGDYMQSKHNIVNSLQDEYYTPVTLIPFIIHYKSNCEM